MKHFYTTERSWILTGLLLLTIAALYTACATREDYDPSLSKKPPKYEEPPYVRPFYHLEDSPTCNIPVNNYLTVHTGTGGDLNSMPFSGTDYKFSSDRIYAYNTPLGANISVSFYRYPETGIYTTVPSFNTGGIYLYESAVVSINSPSQVYSAYPYQSIYVTVDPDTDKMTAKFCGMKFLNLNNPPDTIEMTCRLETN